MIARLLYAMLGILFSGVVFSAVISVIWPVHYPAWVIRASAGTFLAAALVGLAAGVLALRERQARRQSGD